MTIASESNFIEHDGKWWRKVDRKGVVGNTVLFHDGWIAKVNPDDADIDVSAGNTFLCVAKTSDHTVLEPLGTVGEIHVHEGAAYRKVARKAKIGELVLIVLVKDGRGYEKGDVQTCVYVQPDDSGIRGNNGNKNFPLYHSEYVVLEPFANASTTATDDPIFASLAQFPPEITLSDIYEFYARGKRAAAQESFEAEELRFKRDTHRLHDALDVERDIGVADGYWTLVRSHHEKMTYWRKEIEKWNGEIERCKSR